MVGKVDDNRAKVIYCQNTNTNLILDVTISLKNHTNFGFVD